MTTDGRDRPRRPSAPPSVATPHRCDWGSPLVYALALVVVGVTDRPRCSTSILGGFRTNAQLADDPAGLPDPWVLDELRRAC